MEELLFLRPRRLGKVLRFPLIADSSNIHEAASLIGSSDSIVDFHLLGQVSFDDCLALQRRLVYEASNSPAKRAFVLLCEHPPLISVGRSGSREHIQIDHEELQRRQLSIRWVDRSGGCVLHAPGQLAVYAIVPLDAFGWDVHGYTERLYSAVESTIASFNINVSATDNQSTISGRSGVLASLGVAVQDGTAFHGGFVNVAPAMDLFSKVVVTRGNPSDKANPTMSCLLAERRLPARMTQVRTRVIENMSTAFDCDRHNVHTGHAWLRDTSGIIRESTALAS